MAFPRAIAPLLVGLTLLAASPALAAEDAPRATAAVPAQAGQWGPILDFGLPATHQVLLRNGKVLYWRKNDEAKLWDPVSGQVIPVPAPYPIPGTNIHCSGHVVLADGRVLVMGGQVDKPHTAITFATVFDPATNRWTEVPGMNYARWYPTATMLGDGRVLITNGEANASKPGVRVPQVEVYDPLANRFTELVGADRPEDFYSFNFLLPSGRVFNATPSSRTGGTGTATLDVDARSWTPGPDAHWRTSPFTESAAMYRPGKVIRSGGVPTTLAATNSATNQTEVVDMTAPVPVWQVTAPMAYARQRHNLTILADGTVMAVGGTGQSDDPAQAANVPEIWDPDTQAWTQVATMTHPRMYHSAATLLTDGRVLAAGGEPSTADSDRGRPPTATTGQVYSPPYLFKGPRPAITGAPTRIGYAADFAVTTPTPASIASVALIRPSAVTHANNMDQRYVPLAFAKAADRLVVRSPAGGGWAPPGFYMLVIKSDAGVPSIARWVQVGDGPVLGSPPVLDDPADGVGPAPEPGDVPKAGQPGVRRGTTLTAARRIRLRTVRRRGMTIRLTINSPLTASRPVLRVRVLKVLGARRRRLLVTVFRRPPAQGTIQVRLGARTLRHLRYGRYELEAAVGNARGALRAPVRHRFTVTR